MQDAQEKSADYSSLCSFFRNYHKNYSKKRNFVSANSVIGVLLSPQKIAEISLSEVDISKVKISQKAALSFGVVPNLSITDQVSNIDTIGSISQGIVSLM